MGISRIRSFEHLKKYSDLGIIASCYSRAFIGDAPPHWLYTVMCRYFGVLRSDELGTSYFRFVQETNQRIHVLISVDSSVKEAQDAEFFKEMLVGAIQHAQVPQKQNLAIVLPSKFDSSFVLENPAFNYELVLQAIEQAERRCVVITDIKDLL